MQVLDRKPNNLQLVFNTAAIQNSLIGKMLKSPLKRSISRDRAKGRGRQQVQNRSKSDKKSKSN